MNKFTCSTCGMIHPLVTLLEFPQPDIISEISSGQLEATLHVLAKNIYLVDRKKLIAKVELNLNIIDYEDELDILIWAEVDGKHLKEKLSALQEDENAKIILEGKLVQEIPFYRNTLNSPITLLVFANNNDFTIQSILTNKRLATDIKKGIKLKDLTKILEQLYHYDETNFDANTI